MILLQKLGGWAGHKKEDSYLTPFKVKEIMEDRRCESQMVVRKNYENSIEQTEGVGG